MPSAACKCAERRADGVGVHPPGAAQRPRAAQTYAVTGAAPAEPLQQPQSPDAVQRQRLRRRGHAAAAARQPPGARSPHATQSLLLDSYFTDCHVRSLYATQSLHATQTLLLDFFVTAR